MNYRSLLFLFGLGLPFAFFSCEDETDTEVPTPVIQDKDTPDLPDVPFRYADIVLPDFFFLPFIQSSDNMPADNPVTDHGATLGRVLFYDVNLSANRTISCASCHRQEFGFSDTAVLSTGFLGGLTGRHSMGLANARYYMGGRFFWDERVATLEEQTLHPIQDKVEMGMTLDRLEQRLDSVPYYADLFELAFGDPVITRDRISRSLAQFVRSLVSYQSRYDEGRAQVNTLVDPFPNFTASENRGKTIFFSPRGNCGPCHNSDLQLSIAPTNNGLDVFTSDPGVGGFTGFKTDEGLFKVPSLRNIAVRPPYMHDGRFATLEEVIDHYSEGVQNHPNLSAPLRGPNGIIRQGNFSDQEKADLLAFLRTLTDEQFLTDERFSNPFPL